MSERKPMEPPGAPPGDPATDTRKPYQRPRILSREPLEAMAAVCSFPGGKTGGGGCTILGS